MNYDLSEIGSWVDKASLSYPSTFSTSSNWPRCHLSNAALWCILRWERKISATRWVRPWLNDIMHEWCKLTHKLGIQGPSRPDIQLRGRPILRTHCDVYLEVSLFVHGYLGDSRGDVPEQGNLDGRSIWNYYLLLLLILFFFYFLSFSSFSKWQACERKSIGGRWRRMQSLFVFAWWLAG